MTEQDCTCCDQSLEAPARRSDLLDLFCFNDDGSAKWATWSGAVTPGDRYVSNGGAAVLVVRNGKVYCFREGGGDIENRSHSIAIHDATTGSRVQIITDQANDPGIGGVSPTGEIIVRDQDSPHRHGAFTGGSWYTAIGFVPPDDLDDWDLLYQTTWFGADGEVLRRSPATGLQQSAFNPDARWRSNGDLLGPGGWHNADGTWRGTTDFNGFYSFPAVWSESTDNWCVWFPFRFLDSLGGTNYRSWGFSRRPDAVVFPATPVTDSRTVVVYNGSETVLPKDAPEEFQVFPGLPIYEQWNLLDWILDLSVGDGYAIYGIHRDVGEFPAGSEEPPTYDLIQIESQEDYEAQGEPVLYFTTPGGNSDVLYALSRDVSWTEGIPGIPRPDVMDGGTFARNVVFTWLDAPGFDPRIPNPPNQPIVPAPYNTAPIEVRTDGSSIFLSYGDPNNMVVCVSPGDGAETWRHEISDTFPNASPGRMALGSSLLFVVTEDAGRDKIQTLTIIGDPDSGTFRIQATDGATTYTSRTLSFTRVGTAFTWQASLAPVDAIKRMHPYGRFAPGGITSTYTAGTRTYAISFGGWLGGTDAPEFSIIDAEFAGGTTPSISTAVSQTPITRSTIRALDKSTGALQWQTRGDVFGMAGFAFPKLATNGDELIVASDPRAPYQGDWLP